MMLEMVTSLVRWFRGRREMQRRREKARLMKLRMQRQRGRGSVR